MKDIEKRLIAAENATRSNVIPDVVFIYRDADKGCYVASERYYKKNAKGIPTGIAEEKIMEIPNPDAYEAPEGFSGTIINEEGMN